MRLCRFLTLSGALGCMLCLPVYAQQGAPAATAPAKTTPSTTEPVPLPGTSPRAPHTPLRGPYHEPVRDTQTSNPSSTNGTVVFYRQDSSPNAPESSTSQPDTKQAQDVTIPVTDAERTSLTFTSYDCEAHLNPSVHSLSVRARMTVRNDGPQPLQHLILQVSSSLAWYSVNVSGKAAPFVSHMIDSDVDHTGRLDEAVVTLDRPLAVGATLPLDVIYFGVIDQSAERLTRIGAPRKVALSSDWDRIEPEFSGLRGFGNVVWFPVSTSPVLLGDGAKVFDMIGQWKLRESNANVRLHLLVEYKDHAPSAAILNGHLVKPDAPATAQTKLQQNEQAGPSQPQAGSSQPGPAEAPEILRVASFTLPPEKLGFRALGLFVLTESPIVTNGITVYARSDDEGNVASYQQAAELVRPTIEEWLGHNRKRPVILIDLPESGDLPSEDRNILWLPLTKGQPKDLASLLAHMSSHAYFVSPRVWLDEGVAQFMTTIWTEHVAGRDTAIEQLNSQRGALALAEPADPGKDVGQSLIQAYNDVYYRDKAAFVFWMLRGMMGDGALGKALRSYDPAQDHEPGYFQRLTEQASNKHLEWFFDDWVYRDRGLPDLKIASVYSRPLLHNNTKNYLVSVDVENDGYCGAEVPVELQAGAVNRSDTVMVPAHDKGTVRILMQSIPDEVIVNDGTVPEVEASTHRQAVKELQRTN